jgi:hypothetical protein
MMRRKRFLFAGTESKFKGSLFFFALIVTVAVAAGLLWFLAHVQDITLRAVAPNCQQDLPSTPQLVDWH